MTSLFLYGLSLLTSPALAKEVPTIAVVGIHDSQLSPDAQSAATQALVDAIEDEGNFDALNQDEVAWRIQGRESIILSEAFLGPGRRLLDDGRSLHDQALPEDAEPVLHEAVQALTQAMASAPASKDLWTAYMYLGNTYLQLGKEALAKGAWAAAASLNPDRKPNAAVFPPDVVKAFAAVKEGLQAHPGSLVVKADADAEVHITINDVDRGTAPARVSDVLAGTAYVVARGTDGSHAFKPVEISAGASVKVSMAMSASTLGQPASSKFGRSRQTADLYRALGTHAEVDLVLVAGRTGDTLSLQLYSTRADSWSIAVEVPIVGSSDDEAAQNISGLTEVITAKGGIAGIATVDNPTPLDVSSNAQFSQMLLNPKEVSPPKTKLKGWVIALAIGGGVVAAGAAVGITAAATGSDPNQGSITIVSSN